MKTKLILDLESKPDVSTGFYISTLHWCCILKTASAIIYIFICDWKMLLATCEVDFGANNLDIHSILRL